MIKLRLIIEKRLEPGGLVNAVILSIILGCHDSPLYRTSLCRNNIIMIITLHAERMHNKYY